MTARSEVSTRPFAELSMSGPSRHSSGRLIARLGRWSACFGLPSASSSSCAACPEEDREEAEEAQVGAEEEGAGVASLTWPPWPALSTAWRALRGAGALVEEEAVARQGEAVSLVSRLVRARLLWGRILGLAPPKGKVLAGI